MPRWKWTTSDPTPHSARSNKELPTVQVTAAPASREDSASAHVPALGAGPSSPFPSRPALLTRAVSCLDRRAPTCSSLRSVSAETGRSCSSRCRASSVRALASNGSSDSSGRSLRKGSSPSSRRPVLATMRSTGRWTRSSTDSNSATGGHPATRTGFQPRSGAAAMFAANDTAIPKRNAAQIAPRARRVRS